MRYLRRYKIVELNRFRKLYSVLSGLNPLIPVVFSEKLYCEGANLVEGSTQSESNSEVSVQIFHSNRLEQMLLAVLFFAVIGCSESSDTPASEGEETPDMVGNDSAITMPTGDMGGRRQTR